MPTFFSMTVESSSSQLHPVDRAAATRTPASRALEVLDSHRPWEMMGNTMLIIVDQTYAAVREILGPAAPPPPSSGDDGRVVEISRPVDPADPDSPLLCVNASARHCCICLTNSLHGGATSEYKLYTSPKRKNTPQYRLAGACVSVSSGTLHVARVADDGGRPVDSWMCADVRPNVSEKGLFGVLDTVRSRLDAAIRVEANLIEMAKAAGVKRPNINEIIEARMALEKMRAEMDLDEIMRRRRQKRRRDVQEICCRPDSDQVDDAEVLVKRLRALHVSQKRCRPAVEMDQVDDADVLTKRLRAMQV